MFDTLGGCKTKTVHVSSNYYVHKEIYTSKEATLNTRTVSSESTSQAISYPLSSEDPSLSSLTIIWIPRNYVDHWV